MWKLLVCVVCLTLCECKDIIFEIYVTTGNGYDPGTDASVYLKMFGSKGATNELLLNSPKDDFETGNTDYFKIINEDIGDISKIKIDHDGAGFDSGWDLSEIHIIVLEHEKYYFFAPYRWVHHYQEPVLKPLLVERIEKRNIYKMIIGSFTFSEGKNECERQGFKIAGIRNRIEEFDALAATKNDDRRQFDKCPHAKTFPPYCPVYIGYKKFSENGKPSNTRGNEDCLLMNIISIHRGKYGVSRKEIYKRWNNVICSRRANVLCEFPEPVRYKLVIGHFTFLEALNACKQRGMRLATIRNAVDQEAVKKAAIAVDHASCRSFKIMNPVCQIQKHNAYIGFIRGEKGFQWIARTPMSRRLSAWWPGNPGNDGSKNCAIIEWRNSDAKWNVIECKNNMSAMCELHPTVLEKPYKIIRGDFTFSEGKKQCENNGGKIAVIRNSLENLLAHIATEKNGKPCRVHSSSYLGRVNQRMIKNYCLAYVGLVRRELGKNKFTWIGSNSSYLKFASGYPNDAQRLKDCVVLNWLYMKWVDVPCNQQASVLCEVPDEKITYQVIVKINGDEWPSIYLKINGTKGHTDYLKLYDSSRRGKTNVFNIRADDVGSISKIQIHRGWLNSEWWYLNELIIVIPTHRKQYLFNSSRWMRRYEFEVMEPQAV